MRLDDEADRAEAEAGRLAIITRASESPEALDPFVRLYGPAGTLSVELAELT